jgi:putative PIN family toxin of toxin-antitoxin system
LDTNILVSALNFPGNERKIFDLFLKGEIEVFISPFILEELSYTLERKFKWNKKDCSEIIERIKDKANLIEPKIRISVIKENEPDNRIIECAFEANTDFIISGDKKHILPLKEFRGIKIVNSKDFLSKMVK